MTDPVGGTAPVAGGSRSDSRALTVATTVADVLVYLVVLGLTVEYVPQVLSESFSDSLLTAVLLKAVLEAVLALKGAVVRGIRSAQHPVGRATGVLALWLVMVSSKFLVLETVDLVLGDRVSLGGFWSVTGLVVVLVLARSAVRAGLGALLGAGGTPAAAAGPGTGDTAAGRRRTATRRTP